MRLTRVAEADGGLALDTALPLAEAKAHLSVLHDTDDDLITALVEVARAQLEGVDGTGGTIGSAITRHTLDGALEAFPAGNIVLAQPPVASVTWVKYYDADGVLQTVSPSDYHLVADKMRPTIELADGKSWPATAVRPDAVMVRFVVGPDAVPPGLLHAIKMHVAHLYLNREIALEKSLVQMPMGYQPLVDLHRRHGWI